MEENCTRNPEDWNNKSNQLKMGRLFRAATQHSHINSDTQSKKEAKLQKQLQYNQVPHLTQDTTWESNKNTIKITNMSLKGQPFPSRWPQGSNEQTQKHKKHKTQTHKWSTKEEPPWNGQ